MTRPALEFLVVGDPIEHSLSPRIQQAALDWNGIAGRYGKLRVDEPGLNEVVSRLRAGRLHGTNVTMPHKLAAARLADALTPAAARTGAVNTLVPVDGRVLGDSTDIEGVAWAWKRAGFGERAPAHILGAGGAAAAALVALEGRALSISARRREQAQELVERVGADAQVVPWGEPAAAVVVNATPIGLTNDDALPPVVLAAATGLFDMVYGHETQAVRRSRARGITVCDGRLMLVGQAAASFSLWTGAAAPHRVMLAALESA